MLLILKAGEFLQLESHFFNDNNIKAKSKTSIFFFHLGSISAITRSPFFTFFQDQEKLSHVLVSPESSGALSRAKLSSMSN